MGIILYDWCYVNIICTVQIKLISQIRHQKKILSKRGQGMVWNSIDLLILVSFYNEKHNSSDLLCTFIQLVKPVYNSHSRRHKWCPLSAGGCYKQVQTLGKEFECFWLFCTSFLDIEVFFKAGSTCCRNKTVMKLKSVKRARQYVNIV